MSGGGGNYVPTSFYEGNSCVINFNTTLVDANNVVLSSIVVGEELDVTVKDGDVVVVNDSDEIVGKIVHELNVKLKQCIIDNLYVATVLENDGNICKVRVSWVSQY